MTFFSYLVSFIMIWFVQLHKQRCYSYCRSMGPPCYSLLLWKITSMPWDLATALNRFPVIFARSDAAHHPRHVALSSPHDRGVLPRDGDVAESTQAIDRLTRRHLVNFSGFRLGKEAWTLSHEFLRVIARKMRLIWVVDNCIRCVFRSIAIAQLDGNTWVNLAFWRHWSVSTTHAWF